NLKSVFNCSKAAVRQMIKQRYGRIVNITSVIGMIGGAGQTNYAAAKAGIIGFTKAMAKEYGGKNSAVNAGAPGSVPTGLPAALVLPRLQSGGPVPARGGARLAAPPRQTRAGPPARAARASAHAAGAGRHREDPGPRDGGHGASAGLLNRPDVHGFRDVLQRSGLDESSIRGAAHLARGAGR